VTNKPKLGETRGFFYPEHGRKPPEGWLLAHNRVDHGARTRHGTRGFRYFWLDPARAAGWEVCHCGWRPELGVHYARNSDDQTM
jgi:hypothetical protein